jgi:hypothetical protein
MSLCDPEETATLKQARTQDEQRIQAGERERRGRVYSALVDEA